LASIRPIPPFQPIWIYKVPKDGPPNEYSLMHCLAGDRGSRGALAITFHLARLFDKFCCETNALPA
jgi:hypothetical protein